MKVLLTILGAFFAALCALSIFGAGSFTGLYLLYAVMLYLLFFNSQRQRQAVTFLIAATVVLELLGSSRFGTASLLSFFIWVLSFLLGIQLRFTSLYARYIVSVLVTYLGSTFLFFGTSGFLSHLVPLLLCAALVALAAFFLQASRKEPGYELL